MGDYELRTLMHGHRLHIGQIWLEPGSPDLSGDELEMGDGTLPVLGGDSADQDKFAVE